jgi:hypothetical protein
MTLSQERVILPEKRIAMKLPQETDGGTSCPIRESYFYDQTYSRTSRNNMFFRGRVLRPETMQAIPRYALD